MKKKTPFTVPCPKCGAEINPAALLGGVTSKAKQEASRRNAKKPPRPGSKPRGWPKGKKRPARHHKASGYEEEK